MNSITVIDAQGGGVGKTVVRLLRAALPQAKIIAVGTNALATSAMLRAGADVGATGENAVAVGCANARVLVAPIGLAFADAMYGEITAAMALAFARSQAEKILVPMKQCGVQVAGVPDWPLAQFLEEAVCLAVQAAQADGGGAPGRNVL